MKTIYFVRHGEAQHNIEPPPETFLDGSQSKLTTKGHAQASFIAKRAANLDIDLLVSSTFLRAQQTAEYVSQSIGLPLVSSELFVESTPPSSLTGLSTADPSLNEKLAAWQATEFSTDRVEDGENFDDLKARARTALQFLADRPEDNIMVVTHGYFLRYLCGYALFDEALTGDVARRFALSMSTANTGLTIFRHSTKRSRPWLVWVWNDHAHLAE